MGARATVNTALLSLLSLAFAALPATAGVSPRVAVQGRLLDPATGTPRTDPSADLTFRIYAAASGGTAVWSEGPTTLSLQNGVFAAELGASVPLSSTVFAGAGRWLEIQVEAETLAPRQRLTAVPYALRAAAADALADGDTDYVRTGDALQSGASFYVSSASIAGPLTVYGTLLGAGDVRVDGVVRNTAGNALTSAVGLIDASFVDPATMVPNLSLDASSVTKLGTSADVAGGLMRLDGSGLVPDAFLEGATVTKQGNSFNAASQLVLLDGAGLVPNALLDVSSVAKLDAGGLVPSAFLDPSSVTLQSNTFNAPGRLARLDGGALLPNALIDVSSAAKLGPGGYLPPTLMDASSVTLQGNVFNVADRLVRLDANGTLNLPGTGAAQYSLTTSTSVNVTGTGAKVQENGADVVPKGGIFLYLGTCPAGYTEYTALRGRIPLGNCLGCTVGTTAATAFTANAQTITHSHAAGAVGGSFNTGGTFSITTTVNVTNPYRQVRFCQKS
ncbi:hypothetical protein EPO15_01555 [bacterium]|nr:MAG: hypothetical protein EPO15_01555 [bacterium]